MSEVLVKKECPICGHETTIAVETSAYNAWRAGRLIQIALPRMPLAHRDVLITGICLKCQENIFHEQDAEEEVEASESGCESGQSQGPEQAIP